MRLQHPILPLALLALVSSPALALRHVMDPPEGSPPISCVAQGTKIVLTNGLSARVETLVQGARVATQAHEQYLAASLRRLGRNTLALTPALVTRTYASPNQQQAYEVRDDQHHRLIATDDHPMVTQNRGVVRLADLRLGDVLVSDVGPSHVTRIGKVKYTGKVYNLLLGSEAGAASNTGAHTYFANGLLVGDMKLQVRLQDTH
jgi:hypothetical protein